eukprot:774939-Rhodomonas_salina.1
MIIARSHWQASESTLSVGPVSSSAGCGPASGLIKAERGGRRASPEATRRPRASPCPPLPAPTRRHDAQDERSSGTCCPLTQLATVEVGGWDGTLVDALRQAP